mmetsp:Transcript_20912/g.45729  ORF Transcript_20912/g.45729 Transcript_20912/m.45729 type:complete len:280 (-) Transcript_20912:55-894(-)
MFMHDLHRGAARLCAAALCFTVLLHNLPGSHSVTEAAVGHLCNGPKKDTKFLQTGYGHYVCGPLQDDEAQFLFGLVRTLRPSYVLEIGVLHGASSAVIAEALGPEGKLIAMDLGFHPTTREKLEAYPNVQLMEKDMMKLTREDLHNITFDMIFLDASHMFDHYTRLFPFLTSIITPQGILLTHDTGLHVHAEGLKYICGGFMMKEGCVCEDGDPHLCGYPHRLENRQFVNWVLENNPDWQVVHLHSFKVVRHGLTLMTRKRKLSTTKVATSCPLVTESC